VYKELANKKCTKFDFRWGSAPDPAEGAYSAPSGPLLLRGKVGKGRGTEVEGKRRGKEGMGGVSSSPPNILA